MLATSAGIAALLAASRPAFTALNDAGAVYLVYLGIQALAAVVRGDLPPAATRRQPPVTAAAVSPGSTAPQPPTAPTPPCGRGGWPGRR
jgi:threonine/homoserine/homoserine lactone efflux protein